MVRRWLLIGYFPINLSPTFRARRGQMEAEEEAKRTQKECGSDRLAQQLRHEEQMDEVKRELGQAQEKAVGQFRSQLKRKEEELVGLGGVHAAGAHSSPLSRRIV
jgi:hypothetical protein